MKNKSIPPFYVGQEVVAVKTHTDRDYIKGQVHKITSCVPGGCKCVGWDVTIGVRENVEFESFCCTCGHSEILPANSEVVYHHTNFAPITSQFKTIEYSSVIEKEKETVGAN